MGLSTTDLREIKTTIVSTFNDKFLQEIAEKVLKMVETKIEEQINKQNKIIDEYHKKINILVGENQSLKRKMDDQEQAARGLNIRIFGLQSQDGEDLRTEVTSLFTRKLKVNVENGDIQNCYRVNAKIPTDKPAAVLVRFFTDAARISVLKNRKNLKKTGIHIKEDLTKVRLSLLDAAIKKFTSKNAWVLNGNVYVKTNDVVQRVTQISDFNGL